MPHQKCEFDSITHIYKINGHVVPNVTAVLADLIPGWRASEFFLGKGRAVHACAAMVARGIAFEHDLRIAGQVEAVRRFFRYVQPEVVEIEQQVYSERYLYAGTTDLVAIINKWPMIVDYKATITASTIYQCAAYALAYPETIRHGVGVELHEDGMYKLSEVWDLKRAKQEWLALLTTYRIRERLGCLNKEEDNGD